MPGLFMNFTWILSLGIVIAMTLLFKPDSENFIGALESTDRVVTTELPGTVKRIHVQAGQQLVKGQPIIDLTDINLEIMINETRHVLKRLKLARRMAHNMVDDAAPTNPTPMDIEIAQLEIDLKLKEEKRDALNVVALQDGVMSSLQVTEGEHVAAFQPLGTFYSTHTRLIYGFLHETAISQLHIGDQVLVQSYSNPMKTSMGKVSGIGQRYTFSPERLKSSNTPQAIWGQEIDIVVPENHPFLPSEKVNITVQARGFDYLKKALVLALGSRAT